VSLEAPAWALELLRGARVARLGTADAGGQPLVVPVCYAFDGQQVYSAVDAKPKRTRTLRRLRNIAENPRVSLLVDEYDEEWSRLRWVIVEGRAEILPGGAELDRAVALLTAKYPQYRTLPLPTEAGVAIRLTPARVLHWRWT
jgi:PPOX class probable F420-dependent enzyme